MKNLLTLEAFADWCAKKPANETYEFMGCDVCACGQYAATLGLTDDEWSASAIVNRDGFWRAANLKAAAFPWKFGALTARLRSAS